LWKAGDSSFACVCLNSYNKNSFDLPQRRFGTDRRGSYHGDGLTERVISLFICIRITIQDKDFYLLYFSFIYMNSLIMKNWIDLLQLI
jgi:hypothetical protein